MEAIVLAGGLGTRLRSISGDLLPKPMVTIAGRPFLTFVLDKLVAAGVSRICLAVGYRREAIIEFIGADYRGVPVLYSVEEEPLGTGGALKLAVNRLGSRRSLVMNGDTIFDIELTKIWACHTAASASITMAIKWMADCGRYGKVVADPFGRVIGFEEKGQKGPGHINGGIYVIDRTVLDETTLPNRFSFEKDVLEGRLCRPWINAFVSDGYFIDIGVPEDYQRAQLELVDGKASAVS